MAIIRVLFGVHRKNLYGAGNMSQQQQPTLDKIMIQGQVEELRKALGELTERVARLETNFGVSETGLSLIYSALEAAGIMRNGESVKDSKPEPKAWDPQKIKWTVAQGARGLYQKSQDMNSLGFKALLKDLAAHKGKLARDGYFYWTFTNGATVGRKKRSS